MQSYVWSVLLQVQFVLLSSLQEKEAALGRERDGLSRAKERFDRERAKAAKLQSQESIASVRRAEAERCVDEWTVLVRTEGY